MDSNEEEALSIAEELLEIIPDSDSDMTDEIYAKMLEKAQKLDSIRERL